ncbi:MAG: ATP-binding protein [Oscillospiraceae bacterium]|nr:ATP-binding protein [Oscillospiraceae bacterium]
MRFSWKIFLSTLLVVAAGLSASGYILVNSMFSASMRGETARALDENGSLRFAFEMAALNATPRSQPLRNSTVAQIGGTLTNRLIRISGEEREPLYIGADFKAGADLLTVAEEGTAAYRVMLSDGRTLLHTAAVVSVIDRTLYLETLKDVTSLYEDRDEWFSVYRRVSLITLGFVSLITYAVSVWLTRPIRHLSAVTKEMAQGNVQRRAQIVSRDEMGMLTGDFNRMADMLEEQINQLKQEAKAREDFVAAFAHELKTPLTAVIGFADMLRSRVLDEEKRFLAAQYIYREGKRLESLSLRLLDLIVLRRRTFEPKPVAVSTLFEHIAETFPENVTVDYKEGRVMAEPALLNTVLINLTDNARKASAPGQTVFVRGWRDGEGYRFTVLDRGKGIPEKELSRIIEPFYMVDKSRAAGREGVGLGLSLCAGILELHGSRMNISSIMGKGTCITFSLPVLEEDQ